MQTMLRVRIERAGERLDGVREDVGNGDPKNIKISAGSISIFQVVFCYATWLENMSRFFKIKWKNYLKTKAPMSTCKIV